MMYLINALDVALDVILILAAAAAAVLACF